MSKFLSDGKDQSNTNKSNPKASNKILNNCRLIRNCFKFCKIFSENFELVEYVDSGSESKVYSCKIKNSKIKVIAKIVRLTKFRQKVKQEIEIASKLRSNNIITFYGSSDIINDKTLGIFMESAKLGNLNNFISTVFPNNEVSESMLCFIAYQILNGLDYCHRCKVAHMDVKSKNIVIDRYLNVKLIDFSISINYRDKSPSDLIKLPSKGTLPFMPLEAITSQIVEYKDLNKVDIYSFGVLLYNLAFNGYPYNINMDDQTGYIALYHKIKNNPIFNDKTNTGKYSNHFINFLTKLLNKNIHERININDAKNDFWIKGAKILLDESEYINNLNVFARSIIYNQIKQFNDYLFNKIEEGNT